MLIGIVGLADYGSGPELAMSLFYLVPVVIAAHRLGTRAAVVVALVASGSWFAADVALRPSHLLWISAWNGLTRLVIFVGLGMLTARVAEDRRRLRASLAREHALSRTDALTGLANSRALLEACDRELARAQRDAAMPCAIVFFDLDNFKRINDLYGHAEGDRVLSEVGRLLGSAVRGTDLAARLGGDEFVVLLWNVHEGHARQAAERIVARVAEIGARYPDAGLGMSAGLAQFTTPPSSAQELLRRADAALYEGKRNGKGHVVVCEPLQ